MVIYTSFQRERNSESEKSQEKEKEKEFKKTQKTFEKVLTKRKEYDILFELSSREGKRLDLEN